MSVILFEVLLVQNQEEIHDFACWNGGVKGHQNCEDIFVNKLAFPRLTPQSNKGLRACRHDGDGGAVIASSCSLAEIV